MDSTLRRLRRRGITRLGLMVKVTNQRALAFYEKYGFRKLRRVAALLRGRRRRLPLVKDLAVNCRNAGAVQARPWC